MQTDEPTYVIGHRNPDADAICSAIGYAAFKKASGLDGYVPARCGNSNTRIDSILKRFNTPLPMYLGDVTPRVKDIMVRDVIQIGPDATCYEALHLIDHHDIRSIPVVRGNNELEGVISIFDLGQYFVPKPGKIKSLRLVHTCIDAIIKALDAKVLNVADSERVEDMYVRVGAMDVRSIGRFSKDEEYDWNQTIMIMGDRWDIQEKSIQLGARLLVITGDLEVEEDTIRNAREAGVSLIVSPLDSASTAWTIRTATKIEPLVHRDLVKFNPDERVRQAQRRVANLNAPMFFVVDENDRLKGIFTKSELLKPARTRLVLVDHNEFTQAVPGAAEVEISEIIDHHRLGNLATEQPILFINQPVGSTCTIVAEQFRKARLDPDPATAGILMSGLISDTLNLNSPTTTDLDRDILDWLSGLASVDPANLSDMIFSSGSVILNNVADKVVTSDQKIYDHGSIKYSVSQVEELGFNNFWKHHQELKSALENFRLENGLYFAALLITDINTQNSLLLLAGDSELHQNLNFSTTENQQVFELPGIVSRKKQLIPYFSSMLKGMGI